jgi:hypothetical protein
MKLVRYANLANALDRAEFANGYDRFGHPPYVGSMSGFAESRHSSAIYENAP